MPDIKTEEARYYKKFRKTVVISGFVIALLIVSIVFIFFYEQNKYNSLQYSLASLQSEYDSEKAAYNSLSSSYNSLQANYNSLQSNYNSLQSSYNSYKRTIEIRWGHGSDCEQFITPSDSSVISATISALGHSSDGTLSWDDMKTINNWVGGNIKYNYDTFNGNSEDCWLYPSETISRGYGDCEDHALLMSSMCKSEGDAPWIWCAEVRFYKDGEYKHHICIFVDVADDQLYIFEPTSKPSYFFGFVYSDAWHSSSSKTEYDALQEYKQYWSASSMEVVKIFNENTIHSFNSNQEFYDFF